MKDLPKDIKKKQIEYWSQADNYIYNLYNTKKAAKYLLNQMLDSVLCHTSVKKTSKILEIGCAAGTQIIAMGERGYQNLYGLDLSPEAIDLAENNAKSKNISVSFKVGDAVDMSFFPDNYFDVIFSSGVMEHIPELLRAIKEQYRILSPNGILYVQVPNSYCPWYSTGKALRSALSKKNLF